MQRCSNIDLLEMSSTHDCYKQSCSSWSEPTYDREARRRSQHILDLVTSLLYIIISIYKQFQKKQTLKIPINCSILWGEGQGWQRPLARARDCQGFDGKWRTTAKSHMQCFQNCLSNLKWFYVLEKCLLGANTLTDSPTLWLTSLRGWSLDIT